MRPRVHRTRITRTERAFAFDINQYELSKVQHVDFKEGRITKQLSTIISRLPLCFRTYLHLFESKYSFEIVIIYFLTKHVHIPKENAL